LLVSAPVACGESASQASCDDVVLDEGVKSEFVLAFIDLPRKQFLHLIDALSELLAEELAQKGSCHVHSFLAVVVPIVLGCAAE